MKVVHSGICGSNVHFFAKGMVDIAPPMTVGYEFSGSVEDVGDALISPRLDAHVVGDPRLGCTECERCKRGDDYLCADLAFVGADVAALVIGDVISRGRVSENPEASKAGSSTGQILIDCI